jgi:hypothetical protein
VGARTDAARAEVLAAREGLVGEAERLEAAARSAVDIPSKIRRAPAQTAGVAAGAVFLLAGGPQRLFRRVRRAVLGPTADLPKSLLPEEVEKELHKLGDDGERVRRILEREFVSYIEDKSKVRKERDLNAVLALLTSAALKPAVSRAGRELAERLFSPDNASFAEAVERVRARREAGKGTSPKDEGDGPDKTDKAQAAKDTASPSGKSAR